MVMMTRKEEVTTIEAKEEDDNQVEREGLDWIEICFPCDGFNMYRWVFREPTGSLWVPMGCLNVRVFLCFII